MLSQSALFPDSNAVLLSAGTETAVSENTGLRSVAILVSRSQWWLCDGQSFISHWFRSGESKPDKSVNLCMCDHKYTPTHTHIHTDTLLSQSFMTSATARNIIEWWEGWLSNLFFMAPTYFLKVNPIRLSFSPSPSFHPFISSFLHVNQNCLANISHKWAYGGDAGQTN